MPDFTGSKLEYVSNKYRRSYVQWCKFFIIENSKPADDSSEREKKFLKTLKNVNGEISLAAEIIL